MELQSSSSSSIAISPKQRVDLIFELWRPTLLPHSESSPHYEMEILDACLSTLVILER